MAKEFLKGMFMKEGEGGVGIQMREDAGREERRGG